MTTHRVNGDRLNQTLQELARIGATDAGGVTRLALTDEDRAGRDLLRQWMEAAGLAVRIDDLGTMTGRRPGRNDALPPAQIGSHIDTVRQGGRYDGALGVLGGLEVIRSLNEAGIETDQPLELINWTNEEGVRFEPAMMASGVVAGRFTIADVYQKTDRNGHTFGDELTRIGYRGDAASRPGPAAAYVELHIEQGPVLESRDAPVGTVEGILGITWIDITVTGHADHAGPSPLSLRHDALLAAGRIVNAVREIAARDGDPVVGTVGRLDVEPNLINVIPGKVTLSADFRHPTERGLDRMVGELETACMRIAKDTATAIDLNRFWSILPTPFDPALLKAVDEATATFGLPAQRLWSGAGHDAKYIAEITPAAMIFVRSQGGLSHCEDEYSAPDDIAAGANVLLGAVLATSTGSGEPNPD